MTTTTPNTENILRAEMTMLIGNVIHRFQRFRSSGFRVNIDEFASRFCGDDMQLACQVLLRCSFVPEGAEWVTGKGMYDLCKVCDLDAVELACEAILDSYRPVDSVAA